MFPKRNLYVVGIFLFLLNTACEKTPKSGGESWQPVGPYIVESVLSRDVVDGYPAGITNEFYIGDTVHLWVQWENVADTHYVEARFWDPSGNLADSVILSLVPSERLITTFFYILTPFSSIGEWEVGIFLDGQFQRSHLFWVSEERD